MVQLVQVFGILNYQLVALQMGHHGIHESPGLAQQLMSHVLDHCLFVPPICLWYQTQNALDITHLTKVVKHKNWTYFQMLFLIFLILLSFYPKRTHKTLILLGFFYCFTKISAAQISQQKNSSFSEFDWKQKKNRSFHFTLLIALYIMIILLLIVPYENFPSSFSFLFLQFSYFHFFSQRIFCQFVDLFSTNYRIYLLFS